MGTDLEIIYNLRKNLKMAIMRTSSLGFQYLNPEALSMFGFETLREANQYSRKMLFADCDTYLHLLTKLKSERVLSNERVLFKRKDHSNFWGSLTSRLFEIDGEVHYDELIIDVSNEVENEHKLSEKSLLLEKVAGELDSFIYSASHGLRSPISSMRGLISLSRMNPNAISADDFFEMMEDSLGKLEMLVVQLVEFSKNSHEPVLIEPVNIEKIVGSILGELRTHENYDRVHVDCVVPPDKLVYSDFNKIYTTLFHIIKNSFDYLDPNKSNGLLLIRANIQRERVGIEIIDNGIGIERKCIPTIFQLFYRASNASKGSGLGLYLAREAIVRLGGTIEINSEVNLGTYVTLNIPNYERSEYREELKMA